MGKVKQEIIQDSSASNPPQVCPCPNLQHTCPIPYLEDVIVAYIIRLHYFYLLKIITDSA